MSSFYSLLSSNSENEQPDDSLMEIAYYLNLDEELHETTTQQQSPSLLQAHGDRVSTSDTSSSRNVGKKVSRKSGSKIAFKTRSDIDVLDDGYKWRKYGKKMVKNSPNPRNYYRCSTEGCRVKKRVERDQEDSNYVITTYEGVHDHPPPSLATARHPVLQPFHAYPL